METISIINQKGGVGKSTTSAAIGHALMLKGKKVLFVDLDAQGNLSSTFPIEQNDIPSAYSMLREEKNMSEYIQNTSVGDIIVSSQHLSGIDIVMNGEVGKEYRLRDIIQNSNLNYDFIIIDTPPALGTLTINALTASNSIIIPAQADVFSIQGIHQLYSTIAMVMKYCNNHLRIRGIVLNRYNYRSIISRNVASLLSNEANQIGTVLYETKIRECTAIKEAQALKNTIFEYNPQCNASKDYLNLVHEIFKNEGVL
jgi:chromosome partitioning protein